MIGVDFEQNTKIFIYKNSINKPIKTETQTAKEN